MPIEINAQDDFSNFIDHLESVILHYRGSGNKIAISSALRQLTKTQEAMPSEGAALQSDAIWHFYMPDGEKSPKVGDALIDVLGVRWVILELEELTYLGRWKCLARELKVAFDCDDRVDIQRAVWEDLGSGPEIVDWVYVYTALPVKVQAEEITIDDSADYDLLKSTFQIILSEQILLEPNDRFVAEDGTIYKLVSLEQEDRLDVLPIAKVTRVNSDE